MGASGRGPQDAGVNPFAQVALGSMYDPDAVTILTTAIDQTTRAVSEYLATPNAGAGRILAVTGEHGMGKTYLAQHVLNQARVLSGRVRTMYLIARNQTFVELYQDFAEQLLKQSSAEVPDLVRRIYAGIVADSLRTSELTVRLAQDLDDGVLDPVDVVQRYGLLESDFLGALRSQLERVTSQPEFSIALTLMLRPAFESSVREWLLGHVPDPLLRERGIGRTIDSEALALQAMGVFTLLYGHAQISFLLVIDELEQILLRRDRPGAEVMTAFQQFLEIFARAGGFLMLVGVPESVESLRPAIRQRIGQPVRMVPFTSVDAAAIITGGRPGVEGPAALAPFTPATVEYLVYLVGGVARAVVRMGYRLHQTAVAKGVDVTPAMVREVVRNEYEVDVTRNIQREIDSVISASGWPYEMDRRVGQPSVTVDYWVDIGYYGAHCAVLITDSVLDDDHANRLRERAEVIHAEPYPTEVILVAAGIVPAGWSAKLTRAFRSRPLEFDLSSFGDDFAAEFKSAVDRLSPPAGEDDGGSGLSLKRLASQQANVYRLLGQTGSRLEGFRSSSDRQFATMEQLLKELLARSAASPVPAAVTPLPEGVAELFAKADAALDRVAQVDRMFKAAFVVDRVPAPFPFRVERLISADIQRAAGVGLLLHRLLAAFRDATGAWYAQAVNREPGPSQWERLDDLCETFDLVYYELPVLTIDRLGELTELVTEDRPLRRPGVPEAMAGLGNGVRQALRARFDPAG